MALDLNDWSPNGHTLTNNNGVTDITASLPFAASSHAAGFASASSQSLSFTPSTPTKPTGNLTVEAWVKTSTTGVLQTIFQSYSQNANPAGIWMFIDSSNVLNFRSGKNSGTTAGTDFKDVQSSATVPDGNWHHVAGVWDGSNLIIYVDGINTGSTPWANAPVYDTTVYGRIGCRNNSGSNINFFDGQIDDIRVWNTARSSSQISNNKSVELVGNESNLGAYWPLESLSSPSASVSPSSSASASISPSASRSPSSSISPSSSASSSISSSISASLSPSASRSPSASVSPSGSSSPSQSQSPSPSQGYSDYSRGDYSSLPTDDADLENYYTDDEYEAVSNVDDKLVTQTGSNQYMIHQFKAFVGNESFCSLYSVGRSSLAPRTSLVYLQVYNRQIGTWDTVAIDKTTKTDEDWELTDVIEDLTPYKSSAGVISCRIYQLAI